MQAIYVKSEIPELMGNPFAEGLPLRLSRDELYRALAGKREVHEEDRNKAASQRLQLVSTLISFFVPMERHLDLYEQIYSMIENSYLGRNPVDRREWKRIKRGSEEIVLHYRMPTPRSRVTAALIGVSGSGKSTTIDRICALYPEIIEHGDYGETKVGRRQVSIIRVGAHKRSSMTDLCLQILSELDRLLGTNYRHTHGRQKLDALVSSVATLTAVHGVGMIVLDELQELAPAKSGGVDATASLLLHISNTVKSAVLMVGTPKSHLFSHPELHYLVRTSSIPEWRPLKRDSPEWERFLKTLWKYQYTATKTNMSDPLKTVLFDLSQGIPDLAIRIYQHAQRRAILHPSKECGESITRELLSKVANEDLAREMEALDGLDSLISTQLRASDLPSSERDVTPPKRDKKNEAPDPAEKRGEASPTGGQRTDAGEEESEKQSRLDSYSADVAISRLRSDKIIKPGLEMHQENS